MSESDDKITDFDSILLEQGDFFTITRQTTVEGSMGRVNEITEKIHCIVAIIRDITKKDRQVHEMGLATPGNRLIYLRAKYKLTSAGVTTTDIIVKEDDILVDREDKQWRVVTIIHEKEWTDVEIYKKAIIKSINLEGST